MTNERQIQVLKNKILQCKERIKSVLKSPYFDEYHDRPTIEAFETQIKAFESYIKTLQLKSLETETTTIVKEIEKTIIEWESKSKNQASLNSQNYSWMTYGIKHALEIIKEKTNTIGIDWGFMGDPTTIIFAEQSNNYQMNIKSMNSLTEEDLQKAVIMYCKVKNYGRDF